LAKNGPPPPPINSEKKIKVYMCGPRLVIPQAGFFFVGQVLSLAN